MESPLHDLHGRLLIVRPPVPVTINKAGANYKSEVAHLEYSPRRAYDEWLSICEGIVAFGGDAVFAFEPEDEPFLDRGDLRIEADGAIVALGSGERLGHVDDVLTGRVFAANGAWVLVEGRRMRALLPNMLTHRTAELPYYERLLGDVARAARLDLSLARNPHRWEGMADVAAVGDRVVLTYTVAGHYDEGVTPKTPRSSREGVQYAADFAGVAASARIHAELVYPHFHGDTVQFGARPASGPPVLVHYPGGLWGDGSRRVAAAVPIVPVGREDAVDAYAANSRQIQAGVLVPEQVSEGFLASLAGLGLTVRKVSLFELFGKAGGGPACATLYLPRTLELPPGSPLLYSTRRQEARERRARIPDRIVVVPGFFEGRARG
jgi:hypothetical protein